MQVLSSPPGFGLRNIISIELTPSPYVWSEGFVIQIRCYNNTHFLDIGKTSVKMLEWRWHMVEIPAGADGCG